MDFFLGTISRDIVWLAVLTLCALLLLALPYRGTWMAGYRSLLVSGTKLWGFIFRSGRGQAEGAETAVYDRISSNAAGQDQRPGVLASFVIQNCPKCHGRLRFPGDLHIRVTCKHCSHVFEAKKGTILNIPSLEDILAALTRSIGKLNLSGNDTEQLIDAINALSESYRSPLLVTVLGEFSSGKSTFINALLRERLLAMKQRETTATITKLHFGKDRQVTVHFKDSTSKSFAMGESARMMDEYVVENEGSNVLDMVQYVTIELDNPILQHLDVADTPGFNSNCNRHTEITKDFIRYSDLVLWLFDARKMGKASEFRVISEHCKYYKPVGIVNWVNKLPLKDGETPELHLKTKLDQYTAHFERFFFVSAYDGLVAINGEYKQSGMQDVVDYFLGVIIPECNTRKNAATIQRLKIIGEEIVKVQKTLVRQQVKTQEVVDSFNAKVKQFEELQKKFEIVTENWNRDVSDEASSMIDHFDRYFIDNEVPARIAKRQMELSNRKSELDATAHSLDKSLQAIEKGRSKLTDELNTHNTLVSDYYSNHPWKSGFEDFFGVSWSSEKQAINQSAASYTRHEKSFNTKVNSHNRIAQRYDIDNDAFEESLVTFINNTVLPARDKQRDRIVDLAQELDLAWENIQGLNSEFETITEQLTIINKEISPRFAEALQIVSSDKSVPLDGLDLSSILTHFEKQSLQGDSVDWSLVYSRSTMERVIAKRIEATKAEGPDLATPEENFPETIK